MVKYYFFKIGRHIEVVVLLHNLQQLGERLGVGPDNQ